LVTIKLASPQEAVTPETFLFHLDRKKLRSTRAHEGQYLLRRNLRSENPAELWHNYMHLVRIEESFHTFKGDLGLRPIFHQIDQRIEVHVLIPFLPYCLHVTLEQYNKKHAVGLSSRSMLARLSEIQMLDVSIPATDGRKIAHAAPYQTRKGASASARKTWPQPTRPAHAPNQKSMPVVETF